MTTTTIQMTPGLESCCGPQSILGKVLLVTIRGPLIKILTNETDHRHPTLTAEEKDGYLGVMLSCPSNVHVTSRRDEEYIGLCLLALQPSRMHSPTARGVPILGLHS